MNRFNSVRDSFRRSLGLLAVMFCAWAVLGVSGLAATPVVPVVGSTYDPVTTKDMNRLWKKVQGKLMPGFNFLCEEWESLEALKKFDVDMSTREITAPVDINEDGGVASIEDGGYEAFPSSPKVEEISLAFITLSKRFTVSQLAEWVETSNRDALISSQIAYQGKKAIEAMAAQYGDYFHGTSTAVICTAETALAAAAVQDVVVTNGYAFTSITDKPWILRKFKLNERVAIVRGGALVGIGQVTSKNTGAGTVKLTFAGATAIQIGDQLVKANAMFGGAADLKTTDYNKGLVGLTDAVFSTSVHGISSVDVPGWAPSFTDASGGRFNGIRYHKANDEVGNWGGGTLDVLFMDQGVYRDMLSFYQGSLRFTDAFSLEADGEVKLRGVEFKKTRRVPPSMVIGMDKRSYRRLPSLLNKPNGQVRWGAGEKIPNRAAYVFPINFVAGNVALNRANMAAWSGLQRA